MAQPRSVESVLEGNVKESFINLSGDALFFVPALRAMKLTRTAKFIGGSAIAAGTVRSYDTARALSEGEIAEGTFLALEAVLLILGGRMSRKTAGPRRAAPTRTAGKIGEVAEEAAETSRRPPASKSSAPSTGQSTRGTVNAPKTVKDFPGVGTKTSQKQLRHINGRPEYRGGGYFDNAADAQSVLDAFHSGDATIIGTTSQGFPVVRYGGVTGTNVNEGAGFLNQPTNVFIIKGTKSPSVVPTNPNF